MGNQKEQWSAWTVFGLQRETHREIEKQKNRDTETEMTHTYTEREGRRGGGGGELEAGKEGGRKK